MGRYTMLELVFVPQFRTSTYQCILYPLVPIFLTLYPCFAFKEYIGTFKFPFPALAVISIIVCSVTTLFL
jgi:hypothetical protein